MLQVVHRVITRHLLGQARLKADEADSGAVTLIQRFGSAANLNIQLHCLVLGSVCRRSADDTPEFVDAPAPTGETLQPVLHKIVTRLMCLLTRRGVLVEEEGSTYVGDNDGDSDEARMLRPLQAAACTYRITFGPRAGQKVLTPQGAMPREKDFKQTLCACIGGFSLHAAVLCAADDRQALDQLCRCITRPALANKRVPTNAAGQVVLKLKPAWRDGTTHQVMSPLEFMQRLAALVPSPRLHPIRFHGVLARGKRLGSAAVGDPLHRAAEHPGGLLRTLFLCDYLAIPDDRRESHTLLNRGESVHQIQRAIHGGQVAHELGRRRQAMAAISGAHALLTNIVLAWNTNRMDGVVAKLKRDGVGIEEDWLRRIGPANFSHINFRGTFRFNVDRYADVLVERAAGKAAAKSAQ